MCRYRHRVFYDYLPCHEVKLITVYVAMLTLFAIVEKETE